MLWFALGIGAAVATKAAAPAGPIDPDALAGQPVDITPWAYLWRADRQVQDKPEACFIPRRLDRIDRVYRTAYTSLSEQELKSIYYQMPDLLKPLLPTPRGQLVTGLLWTGGLTDYQVELHWSANAEGIPSPDSVEVRTYPTSYGWFGWTVDKVLGEPEVSADRRTWTYKCQPGAKMDFCYSAQVDAATEMVAVFVDRRKVPGSVNSAVPSVRLTSPQVGAWKRMDLEIEWGFQEGTERNDYDGTVEACMGILGSISPLAEDNGTTVDDAYGWRSRATGSPRRGIVVPMLYAPDSRSALDTRVTLWTKAAGFTFRPRDLENGRFSFRSKASLSPRPAVE